MTLTLRPSDPRVHVFSLGAAAPKLAPRSYLSKLDETAPGIAPVKAFGADIDATYLEVFPVADVAPMGLRAYLAQAHDISPVALEADAARLDALTGSVAILAPRAMAGLDALNPVAGLDHIGSYAPAAFDDAPRSLASAATGAVPLDRARPVSGRGLSRVAIGWIVLAALGLAGLLLLLT